MNSEPFRIDDEATPTPPVPAEPPRPLSEVLFDYVEIFAWSVFSLMLIFILLLRLCNVQGRSMENSLYNGQLLLLNNLETEYEQDDIVVFHLVDSASEKTLVKRVIATENQTVVIDFNSGVITVDGVVYEDSHAVLKDRVTDRVIDEYRLRAEHHYDAKTGVFSATVPEGCVFVMGDNRNNSRDSRDSSIAFVDERTILGRVILRISPFTVYP